MSCPGGCRMNVTEVLQAEGGRSTVTTGYTSSYSVTRDGKVIGFVQAKLDNWRLVWTLYQRTGDKITNKPLLNLAKLLEPLGNVDLAPTEIDRPELFFRSVK